MSLTAFEKILKQALILYTKEKYPKPVGRCLDDKKMKVLARGKTKPWNRNRRYEHLMSCDDCGRKLKKLMNKLYPTSKA